MPRKPLHTLISSPGLSLYELYTQGRLEQRFRPADEGALQTWLGEATSFTFHGASGSLNVYQEARPRGGQYWYAYHTSRSGTRKHYLGQTGRVSLAWLEEATQALASESTPPPHTASHIRSQAEPLLTMLSTRLAPPRLPSWLVERERLLAMLDGALATPVTLLSAATGWGKTTLLSAWASRHKAQVAWLSLDELDNSPTRFWVSLIMALRYCPSLTSSFGEAALALLQSPQPPLSACISVLLQELESRQMQDTPIVLILDDYQVIEEPTIHQAMAFWLEHLPANMHLILSSRVDPDLPFARWRARGQVTEIREADLRFQQQEASQYLGQMLSPTLSEGEVRQLILRTEGWAVGLQLVALALQKREDRAVFLQAFTGSQRYLLDYVQEEILARLPTSVRDFLLHSAILSRLDAAVCQAVTASASKAQSQQMLVFLERANLFLVPLDEERRSYRLHDLFREALLACLSATYPELEAVLHRRAASFYEAQGQWSEAIAHCLAAADFSTATRLMERSVEQFWVHGEAATIANWVQALPESVVREHGRLVLTTALYLLNTVPQTTREQRARVYQQMRQIIARVETVLPLLQTDETGPS